MAKKKRTLPVDVSKVLQEAKNVTEEQSKDLSIAIYIDPQAPNDVQAHVRHAFATPAPNVRLSILYIENSKPPIINGSDMAVIVAGLSGGIGNVAKQLRHANIPVMVATTMPTLVHDIAATEGNAIPEGDIIAPDLNDAAYAHKTSAGKTKPVLRASWGTSNVKQMEDTSECEPFVLDEQAKQTFNHNMGAWVIEACTDARLAFASAFEFVRNPLASSITMETAMQNAGIALVMFIPGADMPILTLNQCKMLLEIAAVFGKPLDTSRIKEIVAVVGSGFVCRGVARQVAGAVPLLGWAVKAAVGYGGTLAMGKAATAYFNGEKAQGAFAEVIEQARNAAVKAAAFGVRKFKQAGAK